MGENEKDFMRRVGINKAGYYANDGSYVIDIDDSDEFGKMYSILDNSSELDDMTENSLLSVFTVSIQYISDDYQVSLLQDFEEDSYKIVVTKI